MSPTTTKKRKQRQKVMKGDKGLKHDIIQYFLRHILAVGIKTGVSKDVSAPWGKRTFNSPKKCCQDTVVTNNKKKKKKKVGFT